MNFDQKNGWSNNLINRLEYYVLQLDDRNPTPQPPLCCCSKVRSVPSLTRATVGPRALSPSLCSLPGGSPSAHRTGGVLESCTSHQPPHGWSRSNQYPEQPSVPRVGLYPVPRPKTYPVPRTKTAIPCHPCHLRTMQSGSKCERRTNCDVLQHVSPCRCHCRCYCH